MSAELLEATGNYTYTLYLFTGFFVIALVVSLLMAQNVFSLRKALMLKSEQQDGNPGLNVVSHVNEA